MKERSESEILSCAPIEVTLGKKKYSLPPLAVNPCREWRKEYYLQLAPIIDTLNVKLDPKSMLQGLTASLLQFPEKLINLMFDYREYGYALECLSAEGVKDRDLHVAFLKLLKAASETPLVEAPDFPRADILATATEEQIAGAFSAIMSVAFPFTPQLATVRNLLKANAQTSQA
jgi:hypothetical protein